MSCEIIINVRQYETRVALLEDGTLSEIFIERATDRGITGNIYRGKVTKVLPGMQVAFVDIGLEKSGFLHQSDVNLGGDSLFPSFENPEDQVDSDDTVFEAYTAAISMNKESVPIEDTLSEGQEIMVQVVKDPIGTKGARISSYITLPGRYLVFMPMINQLGVSRRIEDESEKERLRNIIEELRDPNKGYIVRTAAEKAPRDELKRDIDFFDHMWDRIVKKNETASAPAIIHYDLDIVLRSLRDLYHRNVSRVAVDSKENYDRCVEFAGNIPKDVKPTIELYTGQEPIFDSYGIELEIGRALDRKVWLKSGGYIVIDQTEALTAIDVNTGKFVGKRSQEETILQTNLEAVKEIVYQLKLRNMGGIIIIDFIDMEKETSKEKVFTTLEKALRGDRSRTNILRVSELGLVEMTRKRTKESLNQMLLQPCHYCDGTGKLKSLQTICYEIFRELERSSATNSMVKKILLEVSPNVTATLLEEENDFLEKLEGELQYKIKIKTVNDFPDDKYEITVLDFDT